MLIRILMLVIALALSPQATAVNNICGDVSAECI